MFGHLKDLASLFGRRDWKVFGILLVLMVVGGIVEVVGIGVVPVFVSVVAVPERVMKYPAAKEILVRLDLHSTEGMIYFGSAALMLVFLVKNLLLTLNRYLQIRVMKNRQISVMRRLFTAYMKAPYEFHLQRNSAELLRNIQGETQLIFTSVISPIITICTASIMSFCVLLLLIFVNPWITLASTVVLGLAGGVLLKRIQLKMMAFGKQAQVERKEIVKSINQGLGSLKELRLTGRENFFIEDFDTHSRVLATALNHHNLFSQSISYYLETVAVATLLLICVMLVALDQPLEAIAPTLALFGIALVRLKATVGLLVSSVNMLQFNSYAVVPVVKDIHRLEAERSAASQASRAPLVFKDAIELKGIHYRYPNTSRDVLKEINLRIEKGVSMAFVGPTGSGKTTLVDMILGLLSPSEGQVMVDGVDIRQNMAGWQSTIGYVPQVIYLTDDTIRRNIALGLPDDKIDDEEVWRALRASQLEEFVTALPKGLDSVVGERGACISGGQRQRIGIARAIYHNPQVLVLDEGTSSLDNATEQAVMEAIRAMRGTRTILMIAHRLSTVEDVDQTYRMEAGSLELVRKAVDFRTAAGSR